MSIDVDRVVPAGLAAFPPPQAVATNASAAARTTRDLRCMENLLGLAPDVRLR